ncbi:DUF2690 domain-containing protein [Actinomycetospora chiangmaiensis]|uniref:DUF2690 domain-containing protein n=1 Tax=Actinomycetospora chiangmaiensis TaxID=402650 RepID=UPI0003716772|nr:DUF2690 domain-containing protein [Actinomycetospora chiangmaiensis]
MPALTTPTPAVPAARRSSPDDLRTVSWAPTTPHDLEEPRGAGRRWVLLLGGAVVAAAAAAGLTFAVLHPAPAPLPVPVPPVPAPPIVAAHCSGATCVGLDPTALGCQDDARTVAGQVITAVRHGIELPVGTLEVRASPSCGAAWARYAVDTTAPVDGVAIESRDGRRQASPVDPVAGHPRLGYGTTPMLDASAVRAVAVPRPGADLASVATGWTSGS